MRPDPLPLANSSGMTSAGAHVGCGAASVVSTTHFVPTGRMTLVEAAARDARPSPGRLTTYRSAAGGSRTRRRAGMPRSHRHGRRVSSSDSRLRWLDASTCSGDIVDLAWTTTSFRGWCCTGRRVRRIGSRTDRRASLEHGHDCATSRSTVAAVPAPRAGTAPDLVGIAWHDPRLTASRAAEWAVLGRQHPRGGRCHPVASQGVKAQPFDLGEVLAVAGREGQACDQSGGGDQGVGQPDPGDPPQFPGSFGDVPVTSISRNGAQQDVDRCRPR